MLLASFFAIMALGPFGCCKKRAPPLDFSNNYARLENPWEAGKYVLKRSSRVRNGPELSSELIGDKWEDDTVMILRFRYIDRVDKDTVVKNGILRGRIPEGWITVADLYTGETFAQQEDDSEDDVESFSFERTFEPMRPIPIRVRPTEDVIKSMNPLMNYGAIESNHETEDIKPTNQPSRKRRKVQCPRGHMADFLNEYPNGRNCFVRCDIGGHNCEKSIRAHKTGMYRCNDCRFDACVSCAETEFPVDHDVIFSLDTSKGWPSDKGETCRKQDVDTRLIAQTTGEFRRGSIKDGFKSLKVPNIEAWSHYDSNPDIYVPQGHGFVDAIYHAFNNHIPLAFGPDDIWQLIIQGLVKHIENQPDKCKNQLGIWWNGQQPLRVQRNDFVKGSPINDWPSAFNAFNHQIHNTLGRRTYDVLMEQFSTTGPVEKAVHQLAAMASVKNYFKFVVKTDCGISKIKLLGTVDDWIQLKTKVSKIKEQFKLEWWLDYVEPILENIIRSYSGELKGEESKKFWYTIYKQFSTTGSGGSDWVSGWISNFFPYVDTYYGDDVQSQRRTKFASLEELKLDPKDKAISIDITSVPNGVAKTPFQWIYHGKQYNMNFYGGFAGYRIDEEKYIRPVLAWAVGEN